MHGLAKISGKYRQLLISIAYYGIAITLYINNNFIHLVYVDFYCLGHGTYILDGNSEHVAQSIKENKFI